MSTNSEQHNNTNNLSKKYLFLRVCYRQKCKLRSFECFPSFKVLINEITKIYPTIKSKLLSFKEEKTNKSQQQQWRLETNDSDWIENENDWNVIIQFFKKKGAVNSNTNDSSSNNSNHNQIKHKNNNNNNNNNNPIHLTLHIIIDDEENNKYNPEIPSFEKCYKNPLTLIYQRPPPPPYKPEPQTPPSTYYKPPPQSLPHPPPQPHHPQQAPPIYPNPYAPYYGFPPHHPQQAPPTHFPPTYPTQTVIPSISMPHPTINNGNINVNDNINNNINNNNNKRELDESITNQPPAKKRRLNEEIAISPPSQSIPTPSMIPPTALPMPSGPPPAHLLDANPYGIVHMNGYVWCEACNRWFEIHCFDSHLQGKKHKKNIEAFSFRKVLKHWQKIRTKVVEDVTKCNVKELSMDSNLWYAQICLSCLSEVHYSSWHQHVNGQVHQNNFSKCPRRVILNRKMPPGNEGYAEIPTLFSEKYFAQISNYIPGSKVLILGEQDFSYSLAVCSVLQSGENLVGTSYLGPFDATSKEPEEHPADDGIRANYFRKTLPSHDGKLQTNLQILGQYGARTAHNIDGTKLSECLMTATPSVYCGPFDIIVFPFPRASLKRGLDFRNSTLIQGFFNEIRDHRNKVLYPMSQIQMIILENQFKEWDVANIAKENGWTLKWRCSINFASLPQYQPRELSGKAWNPKTARLLVFLWDTEFDKNNEAQLTALNRINDLALLPDEAMKVTKEAKLLDAYHAHGIRQYQDPKLTRLSAPPSSLQR